LLKQHTKKPKWDGNKAPVITWQREGKLSSSSSGGFAHGKTVPWIYCIANWVGQKDSLDSSTDKNPYLYSEHMKYPSDIMYAS